MEKLGFKVLRLAKEHGVLENVGIIGEKCWNGVRGLEVQEKSGKELSESWKSAGLEEECWS